MKSLEEIRAYSDKCHTDVNQWWDEEKGIPYTFHTHGVADVCSEFYIFCFHDTSKRDLVIALGYCHDLIEDARQTYNDVRHATQSDELAEGVYALSNEKGRNRKERANEKYYAGIRAIKEASFVKLCDRVFNVRQSKLEGSRMFTMYKDEHEHFMKSVVGVHDIVFKPIIKHLEELFED